MGTIQKYCLSLSFPSAVVDCYIWLCIMYSPTINYILYGRTMVTVHKLITLLASLLLLLLIVIYDEVGTYNEMAIMDWGLVC